MKRREKKIVKTNFLRWIEFYEQFKTILMKNISQRIFWFATENIYIGCCTNKKLLIECLLLIWLCYHIDSISDMLIVARRYAHISILKERNRKRNGLELSYISYYGKNLSFYMP